MTGNELIEKLQALTDAERNTEVKIILNHGNTQCEDLLVELAVSTRYSSEYAMEGVPTKVILIGSTFINEELGCC